MSRVPPSVVSDVLAMAVVAPLTAAAEKLVFMTAAE
jgi:hypothetical protein